MNISDATAVLRDASHTRFRAALTYCRTIVVLFNAGLCTIEGNTGTIRAASTTAHACYHYWFVSCVPSDLTGTMEGLPSTVVVSCLAHFLG